MYRNALKLTLPPPLMLPPDLKVKFRVKHKMSADDAITIAKVLVVAQNFRHAPHPSCLHCNLARGTHPADSFHLNHTLYC